MDAYRIKLKGLARMASLIAPPPEIGDQVTYTVTATCSEVADVLRRDGEEQHVCGMDVMSVDPQGPPVKPTEEPDLFSGYDNDA
jgi:hypothetical protein